MIRRSGGLMKQEVVMSTIQISLGQRSYPIHIRRGILEEVGVYFRQVFGDCAAAVITDDHVAPLYLARVKAALEASSAALGETEGREYVAMVQAYTSATLAASVNQTYGKAQVEEQLKAAQEAGIEKAFWYNPGGIYPQS